MPFPKEKILLFLFIVPFFVYGQSNNLGNINVLKLKPKRYYNERDSFEIDKVIAFIQDIYYDKPNMNDEEFNYTLFIYIDSINQFETNRVFDLNKDSSIIKSFYSCTSKLNWNQGNSKNSGSVKIISVSPDKIKLQESIIVFDERKNRKILYRGIRTFYKAQNIK